MTCSGWRQAGARSAAMFCGVPPAFVRTGPSHETAHLLPSDRAKLP
jgi:hypothetical protein